MRQDCAKNGVLSQLIYFHIIVEAWNYTIHRRRKEESMDIKKAAMKTIDLIKKFIANATSGSNIRSIDDEPLEPDIHMDTMIIKSMAPEQQPLTAYEIRRKEIEESSEPVEGIFYLYNGQIIPDYYSECLFSDRDNIRREAMYHFRFYPDYMKKKFDALANDEKTLPRGRIVATGSMTTLYIDKCYFNDTDTIRKLIELYRLPGRIDVMSNTEYRCPACYNGHGRQKGYDLMAYTFCE